LCEHAPLGAQLHLRGVPGAAVPLEHAAPVRADQIGWEGDGLRCFQAGDVAELAPECPVGELLDQPHRGGRVHAGPGQHPAQVLDQVRAGERAALGLR
jgi:hypothetical protein